jgi:hypothetical protein
MQLQIRLPQQIEAVELTLNGCEYYAISKGALDALFGPSRENGNATHAGPRKPIRAQEARRKAAKYNLQAPAKISKPPLDDVGVSAAVGQAPHDQRRPSSAHQMCHTSAIYGALAKMRISGQVETKEDPTDGIRKNFLVRAS